MATRRTLDTRSTARALYFTNAFTLLRVLACTASARETHRVAAKIKLSCLYGKFIPGTVHPEETYFLNKTKR